MKPKAMPNQKKKLILTQKNQSNPKSKKLKQSQINLNSQKNNKTTTAEAPVYFIAKKTLRRIILWSSKIIELFELY